MLPLPIVRTLRSDRPDEGFTLVELMVVILIIAILIGAAIPTFLGLRNRAHDSVAQQDLRNTLTAAKVASVDNDGSYAEVTPASLAETEPALEFAALEAGEPITDITDSRVYVAASEAQFAALRRSNSGAYFCAIEGRDRGAEMGRIDDPEGLTQDSLTPEDCSGLPTEDEPESPGLGDLNLEAVLLPNGDTEVTWDPVPGATEYEVCDDDGCQITTDTHYVGRGTVTVRPRNSGGGYIGGGSSTGGGGGGGSAIPPKPTGQGKPTGTIGISYDGTNVQLTWNGLGDVVDRYEVRRCADPGCTDGLTIATVQPDGENDHTYLDNVTALKAMGKTVARYQVVAFAGNLGAASNWAEVYLTPVEGCEGNTSIPDSECAALVALYHATGGPNWTNNTGWLSGDPCDDWYGVTCSDGSVQTLRLTSNKLVGPIPAEIGYLTHLETLRLSNGNLSGALPATMANLDNLTWLEVTNNNLSGSISVLAEMASLRDVLAANNAFSDTLPAGLSNLTNLCTVDLSNNQLEGTIPSTWGNLRPSPTCLNGATWTDDLVIILDNNNLSGQLPAALADTGEVEFDSGPPTWTGKVVLWLANNDFSGEVPAELWGMLFEFASGSYSPHRPMLDLSGNRGCLSAPDAVVIENDPDYGDVTFWDLFSPEDWLSETCD